MVYPDGADQEPTGNAWGVDLAPVLSYRGPQEIQAIMDERVMEILRGPREH